MARKFSTSIVTTHEGEIKTFVAGDTVPKWLDGKVGEHVLEPLEGETVEEETEEEEDVLGTQDEETTTVDDVVAEEQGPAGDVDFTKPAPAKRGPGRPPKNRN